MMFRIMYKRFWFHLGWAWLSLTEALVMVLTFGRVSPTWVMDYAIWCNEKYCTKETENP